MLFHAAPKQRASARRHAVDLKDQYLEIELVPGSGGFVRVPRRDGVWFHLVDWSKRHHPAG